MAVPQASIVRTVARVIVRIVRGNNKNIRDTPGDLIFAALATETSAHERRPANLNRPSTPPQAQSELDADFRIESTK
jgi:hypothetical protein